MEETIFEQHTRKVVEYLQGRLLGRVFLSSRFHRPMRVRGARVRLVEALPMGFIL